MPEVGWPAVFLHQQVLNAKSRSPDVFVLQHGSLQAYAEASDHHRWQHRYAFDTSSESRSLLNSLLRAEPAERLGSVQASLDFLPPAGS